MAIDDRPSDGEDPTGLNLDVYDTKTGLWNPELGNVVLPDDWEFLGSGDAFVTRRVKSAGAYWVAWEPRGRNRPHRRKLGLFAPRAAIEAAVAEAEATAARREVKREANTRQRARTEAEYRAEFEGAVLAWLKFTPAHAALAKEIAVGTAETAVVVGSGRVGRTKLLPLNERAELAARAYIRHRHTDYEENLDSTDPFDDDLDDFDYRAIKAASHRAVDDFLARHR